MEDEEEDVSTDDKQSDVDKLVHLFGSQRQKRALSTAKKNRVDSSTLAEAIEPAFSHAQEKIEASFEGWLFCEPPIVHSFPLRDHCIATRLHIESGELRYILL